VAGQLLSYMNGSSTARIHAIWTAHLQEDYELLNHPWCHGKLKAKGCADDLLGDRRQHFAIFYIQSLICFQSTAFRSRQPSLCPMQKLPSWGEHFCHGQLRCLLSQLLRYGTHQRFTSIWWVNVDRGSPRWVLLNMRVFVLFLLLTKYLGCSGWT
jgi:hypothetical protein